MVDATIKDVANEAEVSVASVSRVLNQHGNVHPQTVAKVNQAIEKLRYVPHSGARSLSMQRTETIGVLLPDLYGEFFSEVIRGIDEAATSHRLQVLMSNSHGDAASAAASLRPMKGRVDGFLVMSPHISEPFLANNLAASVPVVLMNSHIEGSKYPTLNVDNYGGARSMMSHLVGRGHQNIAFISGPENNFEANERLRGYRDAVAELNLDNKSETLSGDFSEDAGGRAGYALAELDVLPDAVFAANDMMAAGCMLALQEKGLSVPNDIAIAGFDDIPVARFLRPGLTTVRVHIADLGRNAMNRLASMINKDEAELSTKDSEQIEMFRTELVIRASCGG